MTLKILHLEDDPVDAELIRMALVRSGLSCNIHAVNTGEAFTSQLREREFDVILSDSGIPGYDGREALAYAHDRCPGVPFIVVSGHAPHGGTGIELRSDAAAGRISKSNLEYLAPTIRHALLKQTPAQTEENRIGAYVRGMQYLVTVVQQLSLARNLEAVIEIVRHAARNIVGADGATFVLREGDSCYCAEEDAIAPLWKGQHFALSTCISGWTILNRQTAMITDIYADARIPHQAYRPTFVKSLVMTPIRTEEPLGAIGVYWASMHEPTPDEVDLLRALAESTSVAIQAIDLFADSERRLSDQAGELQRRSAELEVVNRELEALSYSVAHDLRSPLLAIDGFRASLLENYGKNLDFAGRDHLERIYAALQRMHGYINDLLELSQIVRTPLNPAPVDLSRTAWEIINAFEEENPARQIEVVIAEELVAEGDTGLLHIALEQLLSNAWKFTSKIAAPRIEVGVITGTAGPKIYYVRDNGAGFDPRYAASLYRPFQRLHTQAQFPGSGVGLATVQRIIHRHGGEIWAEADVNQGACFYFTLMETRPLVC